MRTAFLPDAEKHLLSAQLDARFAKFEADIAALRPKPAHSKR